MSRLEDAQSTARDFASRHSAFLHPDLPGAAALPAPFHSAATRASSPQSSFPTGPPITPTFRENSTTDTIPGLIHDARNMVMALDLYCELLDEPGVLTPSFGHYARELRLVSAASRRLMETLARLSAAETGDLAEFAPAIHEAFPVKLLNFPEPSQELNLSSRISMMRTQSKGAPADLSPSPSAATAARSVAHTDQATPNGEVTGDLGASPQGEEAVLWPNRRASRREPDRVSVRTSLDHHADRWIQDLAAELRANHNLLSALAGPGVTVGLSISGGRVPILMAPEDLTRVLVNLVRNAVEAMPRGGELQISLEQGPQLVALSFADNGPGIPRDVLDKIFSPGYSSHAAARGSAGSFGLRLPAQTAPAQTAPAQTALDQTATDCAERPREASASGPDRKLDPKLEPKMGSPSAAEANLFSSSNAWPVQHRGLGLSIVRAIVTAAGGSVWASNRTCEPGKTRTLSTGEQGTSWMESDALEVVKEQDNCRAEKARVASSAARAAVAIAGRGTDSRGAIIHIEFPAPLAPQSS